MWVQQRGSYTQLLRTYDSVYISGTFLFPQPARMKAFNNRY